MRPQPFHEGELEAQRRAGEAARARSNGRAISDEIVPGALAFVGQQPFFLAATLDAAGRPWAWLVAGEPGFVRAPSVRSILVHGDGLTLLPAGLREQLAADGRIGLLFFEPATRRRLRVNGTARLAGDGGFEVDVMQAFPNCPKYIQRRALSSTPPAARSARRSSGTHLSAELVARIQLSDVFFVASRGPDGVLDVSHRGGPPGFVAARGDGTLLVPDYPGNSMFNTFGNLLRDPRASLLFPDFENGDVLSTTGRARIDFEDGSPEPGELATGRSWSFEPAEWHLDEGSLPFRLVRLP
jgi:predicted pyridoxine 5'-phosphate oxidase superfamily flavin-nucleotide-binding protein